MAAAVAAVAAAAAVVGTEEPLSGSGGGGGDPGAGDVALLPVAPLEREARFGSQATWRPGASG